MGPRKKAALVFNETSRREFLTGFHKRKLERKKQAEKKFEEQLKEAKKLIKAKARETYQKYVNGFKPLSSDSQIVEDQYELPHHTVRVQELLVDDIVEENSWIGPNKGTIFEEREPVSEGSMSENLAESDTGAVPLNSVKEIKKLIGRQSLNIMQCSKAFKKKNRLERLKSKKRAARKKRNIEKEKKKLKGRKRK